MLTQGNQPLEFLLSQANGERSRDVVIVTGGIYKAGTVLGKITASGKFTLHDAALTNVAQNAAAVLGYDVDATADHTGVVLARDCEVSDEVLIFKSGISGANRLAAIAKLADAGVVAR